MSRPCFRQPVPVKENFSKPPKLRCSKPQGKVINTAVLLPAAVSLTTDFPLTPTPCLGLRVCQVWYIYIFWYETEKEWKRKKIMWLFRSYVKIVLYYKIFSCPEIKRFREAGYINTHQQISSNQTICVLRICLLLVKKQEEMMAGDICYTFTGYIP